MYANRLPEVLIILKKEDFMSSPSVSIYIAKGSVEAVVIEKS